MSKSKSSSVSQRTAPREDPKTRAIANIQYTIEKHVSRMIRQVTFATSVPATARES